MFCVVLSKARNSADFHVGHLGKAIKQSGKRFHIMSTMFQYEIMIFATPRQHRVNLYKKQSQFSGSFIFLWE